MKYCPRCLRTEGDTASCPNNDFAGMSCPDPVEENPNTDVAISCGPCAFIRIVPVRELLSGAAKNKLPSCRRDDCACVVVQAVAQPKSFDPVMPELKASLDAAAELAASEAAEEEDTSEETTPAKKAPKAKK